MAFQKGNKFIPERVTLMVLALPGEVSLDVIDVRITHGKRGVPGLPGERTLRRKRLVNPFGRIGLDRTNGIGHGRLLVQPAEQVHMVRDAAGRDQATAGASQDATDVFVQPRLEVG